MSKRWRISQPELSDDDGPLYDPGYHDPSSSKSKTSTVVSTQTPITSLGSWNDQKIWIFIGIFLLFQILTGMMVVNFKSSLENNITNLKSCQKKNTNSDGSLSCSDCMCIATDGFSSKEFLEVVENQKRIEEKNIVLTNQLSAYENEVMDLRSRLSNYENLNKAGYFTELLNENWDKTKDVLNEEFEKKEKSLRKSLINEIKEEVKANSQNIQSQLDQQHGNIANIKENITKADVMQAQLENGVKTIEAQTDTLIKETQTVKGKQSALESELISIKKKLTGVDGQLNFFSKEIYDINLYMIVFLVGLVIAVIFATQKLMLYRQPQSPVESRDPSMRSGPKQRVGGKEVSHTTIYATLSSKTCERGISIISFHSATQKIHQNLLKVVPRPRALPVQAYLIENQVDLSKVNPYMITIIFVDFNERNIILENPEIEVGDHRRFTTEIFLELGCDVFVVYCKDRDSQNLPPNQLYNTKLHSINQHATLSKLKKKDRVFSVYETLHPQQVKLLENCFKQL